MAFPPHIDRVLVSFGIAPDLKAALYDHWLSLGDLSLEAFANAAEAGESLEEAATRLPALTAELYVRRYHHLWKRGAATPSYWKPRTGTATGVVMSLGNLPASDGFAGTLSATLGAVLDEGQPVPSGIVTVSKNAHFGGRQETISFDIVNESLEGALAVALASGRQHTVPGSIGETSGTVDEEERMALLWEVQPNVLKPAGERNRAIASHWRRHRNWHRATLTAALLWLSEREYRIAVLSGRSLRHAHEVNPEQPIGDAIMSHHDATVQAVAGRMKLTLEPVDAHSWEPLMNHGLRQLLLEQGGEGILREVRAE